MSQRGPMADPDDLNTVPSAEIPDDLATLRVAPPTPSELPYDLATMLVAKPVVSPTLQRQNTPSYAGANPAASAPLIFGKRIAQGGMGAILEANDCKLGRTIAVKVMLSEADCSEEQKQRFIQEAAILGRLEHPNIVPIHDLGLDPEGQLYYTMKLVKGETLQNILDRLRQEDAATLEHYTLDRLLTIFRKVCDALAFAHANHIIHRDLKPENVMVGEFGEVLVMDWGISKVMGNLGNEVVSNDASALPPAPQGTGSFTATMEGAVMGTPNYMSPEQAMGKVNELDERSDIFSLGGILYAILTLRPPVEGKDVWEVLEKVQMANITEPTKFGATTGKGDAKAKSHVLEAKKITPLPHMPGGRVPHALSSVAMKALTLDKAKRYQNVAAFSADIEKYQGGFATSAENAGLTKQVSLLIKRNKGIFTTAAAAWLLITGLAVLFVFNLRAKEQRATEAEAIAVQREAETSKALGRSAISLAEAALRESNGPAMQAALKEVPENLRDSTWRYLLSQSDTSIARVDVGAEIDGVVAHPRLPGVFAAVDQRGKVTILNVRTGERLREFTAGFSTQGKQCLYCLAFSPDGERLAIGRSNSLGDLVIHEARAGNKILEVKTLENLLLLFSPDGRWILRGGKELQDIGVVDAQNGQPRWIRDALKHVLSAAFTPDGGQVLLQAADTELWSSADGSLARAVAKHGALASALHPDGQLCVTGDRNGTIRGVNLSDGSAVFEFRTDDRPIDKLAFTANGKLFASTAVMADGRQMIRLWDARTGAPVQSLLGGSGKVRGISVHPLSGEVVVCGPETRAWSLGDARWSLGGGYAQCAFWGKDDVMVAPARESDAALVRLQEGSATTLWAFSRTGYREKDVSADGRLAVFGAKLTKSPFVLLRRAGETVEEITNFTPGQMLQRLCLSPSGASLAAIEGLNDSVEVFDSSTGKKRVKLPPKDIKRFWEVRWLDEKELVGLVTAKAERGMPDSEEWVVRWDATTGKVLQTATNPTTLDALVVAPDGRRFAEAGADKRVRVRDSATLAVLKEFRAHDGPITALAWHPKKPILASGSSDLAIRLWNLETSERIDELRGPLAAPHTLAFAPSGQRLGCASLDATTYIWDPPSLRDETAAPVKAGSEAIDERVWFKQALPNRTAAPQPEKPKAALPTDADGWEDHLASLTPVEVEKTVHGWSLKDGELFSPNTKWTMLPLPGDFSNTSYRMRVRLRRTGKRTSFTLLLPTAAWKCGFAIDGDGGKYTGILSVNGKFAKDIPGVVEGQQVNDTEPHDLEVIVRLDDKSASTTATISATLDSRPLYKWTGPTAALSQDRRWATIDRRTLALGTNGGGWAVSEVKVKRLEK
ncbi:protein kinase [Prosthecobacter sp.]|uniref:protein kinase domain-containing protein n=1 Tax=Prosthecobacter sp. TaxID=1965333 RepID=UPI001DF804C0|nr:protein kinase [Prosthecobacter sp.]MCB1276872.1 protein kinase [Prosthecobacter sp.]